MVVSGLRLAALGVAGGVVLSPGARDVLANVLFGVAPGDPVTLVGAVATMALTALAGPSLPERRAARIAPLAALRKE